MKKYFVVILCCLLLLLSGCSTKYRRISFDRDTLGEDLANHISEDSKVVNTVKADFPSQLPIYKITKHNISEQEFQQMLQQLEFPKGTSPWHGMELEGNKVDGYFADYGTGSFTMSEEELEILAWETFSKIPFMEGNYEYSGIRGKETLSDSKGEHITSVLVSFYRLLDNIRVIGNERCDLWFNDSGLVEIHIAQFDYKKTGTMDMVTLEDASAKIKTPDDFSIDTPDTGRANIAATLQVNRIKLLLVNQYSEGCTILQPVYNFIGIATLEDGIQAEFSSKIIAIPESYTYEVE